MSPVTGAPAELAGLQILIVDDDADAVDILRTFCEHRGATAWTASCGKEALLIYARLLCDVLISDLAMPHEDGFETVALLKDEARRRGVALWAIALTGHVQYEVRQTAVRAGFDVFLTKPVDLDDLVKAFAGRSS